MPDPFSRLLDRVSSRVITPRDTDEQRLHKTLLIFACGLMGFAAMLWMVITTPWGSSTRQPCRWSISAYRR